MTAWYCERNGEASTRNIELENRLGNFELAQVKTEMLVAPFGGRSG
jgi:hypothetical protein